MSSYNEMIWIIKNLFTEYYIWHIKMFLILNENKKQITKQHKIWPQFLLKKKVYINVQRDDQEVSHEVIPGQ